MRNVLLFCTVFTVFTTYPMETRALNATYAIENEGNCSLFKTKDKRIIAITNQDRGHSLYLSSLKTRHYSKHWQVHCIKINIKEKCIKFFQEIIHKPALYDSFSNKKYYKALTVAVKLQAPLLYAELLNARLPQQAVALITQKYMRLKHMPYMQQCMVNEKEYQTCNQQLQCTFNRKEEELIKQDFSARSETLKIKLNELIAAATLPQVVLLSLIRKTNHQQFDKELKIIPHMPGYNTFVKDWTEEQQSFLCDNLPLKIEYLHSKNGNKFIQSIRFTV